MVQLLIFLCLFVMMFDTYPFRVGLMGLLASQFSLTFAANVFYVLLTAIVYGFRVVSSQLMPSSAPQCQ